MTQAVLKDYVAIITGAGQGIGQGIALALAKKGVRVVAVGRTLEKCQTTCDAIAAETGMESLALQCDVSLLNSLESVVEETIARFGRIDILVNNAVATSQARSRKSTNGLSNRPHGNLKTDATLSPPPQS
jgi:NAD(P)-dependent dehydrogenase (short-subunit alcohol dehydrogenase family)